MTLETGTSPTTATNLAQTASALQPPRQPTLTATSSSLPSLSLPSSTSRALLEAHKQRRRGALSCAECRRLKLRCDRQFPCQSCRKRGCAAICPDGALTTGKGNRFILANTEELHDRIDDLQERISSLEQGLSALYNSVRTPNDPYPHPLLTDELLNIKTPIGAEIVGTANPRLRSRNGHHGVKGEEGESDGEHAGELTESFGTLAMGEGKSTFFGNAAGAQFLLGEFQDPDDEEKKPSPSALLATALKLDPDSTSAASLSLALSSASNHPLSAAAGISDGSASAGKGILAEPLDTLSKTFPFVVHGHEWPTVREKLKEYLPDPHHAWALSEQFFELGAWLYCPVSRYHYMEKIFTPIMDPSYDDPTNPTKPQPTPADYSLLFIVLALGSILDISRQPQAPETLLTAELYHTLSRAALGSVEPLPDTLTGVQTLLLMCYYNQFSYSKKAPMRVWMLCGIACKMAMAMGLHRDGKRWNLGEEECQIRRTVYWELMMFDTWASQALGRPPTMWSVHCDVQMPDDITEFNDIQGRPEPSFRAQKYRAASMMVEILNEAFAAKRPPYDTILRLDRRVRDLVVPPSLTIAGFNAKPDGPPPPVPTSRAHIMQSHAVYCIKEVCLIYLHRGYLARALAEHPEDPFKSRYHASVVAVHSSSCAVLAGVRNAYALLPELMPRVFFLWVHAFSAAIVLATIVIRAPSSSLVQSSLKELDIACELFERAKDGCRPGRALPPLLKLRDRARRAYEDFQHGRRLSPMVDAADSEDVYENDDITMLGAKSRLVRLKTKSTGAGSGTSGSNASATSQHDETASLASGDSPRPTANDYHPALAEYLKEYNAQLDRMAARQDSGSPPSCHLESLGSAPGGGSSSPGSGSVVAGQGAASFDSYGFQYIPDPPSQAGVMMSSNSSSSSPEYEQPLGSYQQQPSSSSQHPPRSQSQPPHQQQIPFHQHHRQLSHDLHPSIKQPPISPDTADSPVSFSPQYALGPSARSPVPFFAQFSPQTPFSAFEPSLAIPRRDGVAATNGSNGSNVAQGPGGSLGGGYPHGHIGGMAVPSQFTGLDASLGQAPEAMDLGWQFMSDLRTYL